MPTRRGAIGTMAIGTMAMGGAGWLAGGARAAAAAARVPVFGHRGCPALRPEHTLASYAKAIRDGADSIEPDLVVTRDGVLVVRHENDIAGTTDVAAHPGFADRRTRRTVDGQEKTGWFTEDFTLAELKTLRAVERLGALRPESRSYDGRFQIVSFEEVVDFAAAESAALGRPIGLVPELKHSTYFARIGLPLEERFLAAVAAHDHLRRAPLEVQSFEIGNLRHLRRRLGRPANLRLMQLVDPAAGQPADVVAAGGSTGYAGMTTPAGLREVAIYADVIAPPVRGIVPLRPDGRLGVPSPIVRDAHAAGLLVRPWTFRPENRFLAADFRDGAGDDARNPAGSVAEIRHYLATGIDGFFTDDPAIGRAAVDGLASVTPPDRRRSGAR